MRVNPHAYWSKMHETSTVPVLRLMHKSSEQRREPHVTHESPARAPIICDGNGPLADIECTTNHSLKSPGNKVNQCLPSRSVQFVGIMHQRLGVSWPSLENSWMSHLVSEQDEWGWGEGHGALGQTIPQLLCGLLCSCAQIWGRAVGSRETSRTLKWGWCANRIHPCVEAGLRGRETSLGGESQCLSYDAQFPGSPYFLIIRGTPHSHLQIVWNSCCEHQLKLQWRSHLGIYRVNSLRVPQ